VILGCSGFSGNGHGKFSVTIAVSEPDPCTAVNHTLQQIHHQVSGLFIKSFVALGLESGNHISVSVS
jgi:hypothetical protein